jgi:hypothetical protein
VTGDFPQYPTWPNYGQQPCPSCGTCPTCGRRAQPFQPWPYYQAPWTSPWMTTNGTVTLLANPQATFGPEH